MLKVSQPYESQHANQKHPRLNAREGRANLRFLHLYYPSPQNHSAMKSLKLAAETIGIKLSEHQVWCFQKYYEMLEEHGRTMNLTSVKGANNVEQNLFIRSLRIAVPAGGNVSTAEWFSQKRLIDIGSGAGFPGIVLKIALPDAHVTLLEARAKRCRFMEKVIQQLALENVEVINARAEGVAHNPKYREQFQIATARAVAPLPTLAELVLPFVTLGGVAIIPKGSNKDIVQTEIENSQAAAQIMGAANAIVQKLNYPGTAPTDHMIYWMKIRDTHSKYPRRPGIPAKRPITNKMAEKAINP